MAISTQSKSIQTLVGDIREGKLLLPEMQRRYVWKTTQVRDLFDSLYHQYPSGQLLVWVTDDLPFSRVVGVEGMNSDERRPQLLLDGQQRLTSLAAIMLGRSLIVRGSKKPIEISFNIYTEKFEVTTPIHRIESGWISLSRLFTHGLVPVLRDLKLNPADPDAEEPLEHLNKLENIKNYMYHVNLLENLSYEEVTDIFVRINSGGTTLARADLALAQVSSRWRGFTREVEEFQKAIRVRGLEVNTGVLLRALTALLTGQSFPSELFRGERQSQSVEELAAAWRRVENGMTQSIDFLIHNCRIDRFEFLPTQNILIPLTAFFDRFGSNVSERQSRDLQRWVYLALIWSRYSGSSDTAISQDVTALTTEQPIRTLIQNIEDKVGRRPVTERELQGQRKNSPFMLMAYILARNNQAQDWFNGIVIGSKQNLELHHIFPKAVLEEAGYNLKKDSRIVDQVANLAFLSQRANAKIASRPPSEYLPDIEASRLAAQYVPFDPALWVPEKFEDFLTSRRSRLATAINKLIQSLSDEPRLWPESDIQILETRLDAIERQLRELIAERLTEARGEHAWEHSVPASIRNSITHRIEQRIERSPFENGNYGTLLHQLELCQFSDYPKIMKANWPLFQDIFGEESSRLDQNYQAVTAARNALKHNDPLNRSEIAAAEAGLVWLEDCLRVFSEQEMEEHSEDDE